MIIFNKAYKIIHAGNIYINVVKVIIGVMLLFAGSQIVINIKPVPINLITLMASLVAFTYSPKLSAVTVASYLLGGIFGLPMFANYNFGLAYLLGPTGGYLLGITLATPIMSWLKDKLSVKVWDIVLISFIGHIIIFLCGVGWLTNFLPINKAIYSGFLVFIPSGAVKIGIFAVLFSYVSNKIK